MPKSDRTHATTVVSDSSIVRVEALHKVYGTGNTAVVALDHVNLSIRRAEFVAIMGPSGCGKSTLLHLLGGLDRPTSGHVLIDGIDLGTLNDDALSILRRERIGFVFQFFNLIPVLSAAENVALPLLLAGHQRQESARRPGPSGRVAASGSGSPTAPAAGPTSSRADSSSGSRSLARWSPTRRSCSPTSRPATSTRVPPTRCYNFCARPRTIGDGRSSWSRTTPEWPPMPTASSS